MSKIRMPIGLDGYPSIPIKPTSYNASASPAFEPLSPAQVSDFYYRAKRCDINISYTGSIAYKTVWYCVRDKVYTASNDPLVPPVWTGEYDYSPISFGSTTLIRPNETIEFAHVFENAQPRPFDTLSLSAPLTQRLYAPTWNYFGFYDLLSVLGFEWEYFAAYLTSLSNLDIGLRMGATRLFVGSALESSPFEPMVELRHRESTWAWDGYRWAPTSFVTSTELVFRHTLPDSDGGFFGFRPNLALQSATPSAEWMSVGTWTIRWHGNPSFEVSTPIWSKTEGNDGGVDDPAELSPTSIIVTADFYDSETIMQ